jgi:chromosome segregation ATPase
MARLEHLTPNTAAKLTDLNPLIDAINDLGQRVADLESQVAATAAEQGKRTARIGDLEAYAQNNSRRIDDMEVRYDRVVDEMEMIANNLTAAVADLAATDEASGWKQWKEQRKAEKRGGGTQ